MVFDRAIGGLYLDADDFLHTGFLCHCCRRLSGEKNNEAPSCSYRQTVNHRHCLSVGIWDWLAVQSPEARIFPQANGGQIFINGAKRSGPYLRSVTDAVQVKAGGPAKDWQIKRFVCALFHSAHGALKHCFSKQPGEKVRWKSISNSFISTCLDILHGECTPEKISLFFVFNCCFAEGKVSSLEELIRMPPAYWRNRTY